MGGLNRKDPLHQATLLTGHCDSGVKCDALDIREVVLDVFVQDHLSKLLERELLLWPQLHHNHCHQKAADTEKHRHPISLRSTSDSAAKAD